MDAESFERLCTESLAELVGHRAMVAAVGRISQDDCAVRHAWNFGCPPDLFGDITSEGAKASQPTLKRWLKAEAPIFIDAVEGESKGTNVGLALARHKLECFAVHGIVDGGGSLGSCVAVFGLDPKDRVRVTEGLRLVVPYLHAALMRLCRERSLQATRMLTERERQLIRLVVEGHSNPQIARQWSRSVATVRNLLHVLMSKLNVSSRAQLAVIAIQTGLLESPIPLPPIF
jgi:DNA-binding CsgD family transcriptional regulator